MAKRDLLAGCGLILVGVIVGVGLTTLEKQGVIANFRAEEQRVMTSFRTGVAYAVVNHGAVCRVAADLELVADAEPSAIAARSLGCVVIGPGFKGTVLEHQGVLVKIRVTTPGAELAELENFAGWTAAANLGEPAT
jgi:hypothetical protein